MTDRYEEGRAAGLREAAEIARSKMVNDFGGQLCCPSHFNDGCEVVAEAIEAKANQPEPPVLEK